MHDSDKIQINILQIHRERSYPPTSGGETRVWKTAQKMTNIGTVWLGSPWDSKISLPGEIRPLPIPTYLLRNKFFRSRIWYFSHILGPQNTYDRFQTDRILSAINDQAINFDVVVCESPQMFSTTERISEKYHIPAIINMHNAEFVVVEEHLSELPIPNATQQRIVRGVKRAEQRAINIADAVVFQSAADKKRFDTENVETFLIPNGCDYDAISSGGDSETLRQTLNLQTDHPLCIFIGAYDYTPNRIAARVIAEEIAPAFPNVEFLLFGRDPPTVEQPNVYTPGYVEDLPAALSLADIALCPLTRGSGTKLKMLDYMAAGLPIVTTDVGAQGISVKDGESVLIRDSPEGFISAIRELLESPELRRKLSENASEAGEQYSWNNLLDRYDDVFETVLSDSGYQICGHPRED